MALDYVTNALGGTTTTTSFSITLPATQADDILILEFTHRGTGDGTISGTSVTTDGLTWTLKHSQLYATSAFSGKTYWTRATGNHTGKTVTGASLTNSCAAVVTVYRGARTSGDPLSDATIVGEQNASTNETQAQITTATNGAYVVLVVVNSPDVAVTNQACTSPGALTARAERLSTGGTDTSVSHASAALSSAGATGAFTWSQTDGDGGSWAYAIEPSGKGAISSTGTSTATAVGAESSGGAITHTALTSGADGTNQTSKATASITPAGNELIEVAFEVGFISSFDTTPPVPDVTGNGITYTLEKSVAHWIDSGSNYWNALYLFRGMAASPSTGAITIDFGATTMDAIAWSVSTKGNVDTSGTNGSGAIVQSVTATAESATSAAVTLAAFGSANNATAGYFGQGTTGGASRVFTQGTGFTEIHETGNTYAYVATEWRVDNDTSIDGSYDATCSGMGGIAVEIKAAATITSGAISGAGSGTATTRGAATASVPANSAALSTATSKGAASAASLLSANGTASVVADGSAAVSSVASATGNSTGEFTADALSSGDANGVAVSTAEAVGDAVSSTEYTAYSSGTSTSEANGSSESSGAASSAGASEATAVGGGSATVTTHNGPRGRAIAAKQRKKQQDQERLISIGQDEADSAVIKAAFEAALAEYLKMAA